MSGLPRRPPLIGISRTNPRRTAPSTLPRSRSNSVVMQSSPSDPPAFDRSLPSGASSPPYPDDKLSKASSSAESVTQPLRDSLARDPFVSISRAIHSAKLRAAANIRAMAPRQNPQSPNKHFSRLLRFRPVYLLVHRFSRIFALVAVLLFVSSVVIPAVSRPRIRFPSSGFSFHLPTPPWRSRSPAYLSFTSPSLKAALRHRPRGYAPDTFATGPWLIALVTDLDRESCRRHMPTTNQLVPTACTRANIWVSYFKRGILTLSPSWNSSKDSSDQPPASVVWIDEMPLEYVKPPFGADLTDVNRFMELSELTWFHGSLLAPDDRTGALIEITSPHGALEALDPRLLPPGSSQIPPGMRQRAVMFDGDGVHKRPFKAEWMAVQNDSLFVGGHGRPFTHPDNGALVFSLGPKWVKVLNSSLGMKHYNWSSLYDFVAQAAGVEWPGYLMHEAVLWSAERHEWVFLPRRRSTQVFSPERNQHKGWNVAVVADAAFKEFRKVEIPGLADSSGLRGFSTAKFIPGSEDRLVLAVRTVELEQREGNTWTRETSSYVSVFDIISGALVLEETKIGDKKFEGLEFL